jgi:GNAT superfamily N-acetyltransferase
MSDKNSATPIDKPELSIRQAIYSDIEALAKQFDQYRVFQGKQSDVSAAYTFLKARFDHGESVVFIAFENSEAIGFAQLYPSYSSTALARVFILNDLFVLESGRRKGVGSRLLAAIENYAWSHGAARVTLNVAIDNETGQKLYQNQGWKQDEQFLMFHRFPNS